MYANSPYFRDPNFDQAVVHADKASPEVFFQLVIHIGTGYGQFRLRGLVAENVTLRVQNFS